MKRQQRILIPIVLAASIMAPAAAQTGNRADRLEWFRDAGFGLFIHWGVDVQLGSVISHSLAGASDDYVRRYFAELPGTFYPKRFDAREWAALAKIAGVRYVMFTAKHHSGFCLFDTATTPFQVKNSPYRNDITGEVMQAFREQGIPPGLYYSPDDFWYLHQKGVTIDRNRPEVAPANVPGLLDYDKRQLAELLTNYGKIHALFLDGPPEGLRELAWQIQPDIVVTRGAIETPEQYIPGVPIEGAWESCLTMGTQWQYKPTNEEYKSGGELITTLIETRAKGGNLLLNIGPKPDGTIPPEQEDRLREIGLWMFINGESIYGVRPWVVTNEKNVWFTRKKGENTVYAIVTGPRWPLGEWKTITLHSLKSTTQTQVSVLGQNDKILEYRAGVVPKTTWKEDAQGFHITAMRAQRIYNDRRWPNPVVLKITNVEPGMAPPEVVTSSAAYSGGVATLRGDLRSLGKAESVEAGFQYRRRKGLTDLYEKTEPWQETEWVKRSEDGSFSVQVKGLQSGAQYDYRAVVKHPLITIYGAEKVLSTEK